ncbi:XRE family transcriptional regulator [uncultured Lactobacillus sp.]|uniref:XRE family transcriptional regulator n=1 Tax=uncultured Lactobacillus sp. TaxID=153152 RepID=UPI0028050E92|nr:XRE family transcriptional regulator [uncultured Lactobacillus sp.]
MKNVELNRQDLIKNHQLYPAKVASDSSLNDMEMIGKKPSVLSIFLSIVIVVLVALLFTGFGYQPWWVLAIVLVLGLIVTLPVCFNSYWLINDKEIKIFSYSNNDLKKFSQLINLTKMEPRKISFNEIEQAQLIYKKNVRISPFDFNPDRLSLVLNLKNNEVIDLDLREIKYDNLLNIINLLNGNGVDVFDKQEILLLLSEKKNLFNHFHKKWATL